MNLRISSMPNFRDAGGHRTAGGGTMRPGLLYRSDHPDRVVAGRGRSARASRHQGGVRPADRGGADDAARRAHSRRDTRPARPDGRRPAGRACAIAAPARASPGGDSRAGPRPGSCTVRGGIQVRRHAAERARGTSAGCTVGSWTMRACPRSATARRARTARAGPAPRCRRCSACRTKR